MGPRFNKQSLTFHEENMQLVVGMK
uniref:Uncharacterized protein n=1 Tax=Arundo donax TaxID=35708 RepID=A0A0A9BDE3_ARUDO